VTDHEGAGGWTFLRILGLLIGVIGMTGFGVCSLCGLVMFRGDLSATVLGFVIPGLILAYLFFLLARAAIRRSRQSPRP
jgi:hypothetical protein